MNARVALPLRIAVLLSAALAAAMAAAAERPGEVRVENAEALARGVPFTGFIVKFRDESPDFADVKAASRSLEGATRNVQRLLRSGPELRLQHARRTAVGADVVAFSRLLSASEAATTMALLSELPNVEYVEPDLVLQHALTPNDPLYGQQWAYSSSTAGIRANQAWDVAKGDGIVVAVLDTGQAAHSELAANTVAGYDFVSNLEMAGDGNGRDADASDPGDFVTGKNSSWHGTHVAGTIAARGNNGAGVIGTAFNAKVMPVRVLGRGGGSTSDIADAIVWASGGSVTGVATLSAANAADVLNLSLGGPGACSSTLQNAINGAVNRGVTVVVAAGNSNLDAGGFNPANCNNVIAVAAVTSNGTRASFSNFGSKIAVSAPGAVILSTANAGTTTPGNENYLSFNGTSMAAPHVAGTVALVQSRRLALGQPLFTPAQIRDLLVATAYPLPGGCPEGCGAGIVNAKAAVDAAQGGNTATVGTLSTGVAVANLAGALNDERRWTLAVPSGATNLKFELSGGTGNADLYVRANSAPTASAYDCRPYLSGNAEACTIAAPVGGTWHVMVKARAAYSGASLKASFTAPNAVLVNNVAQTGIAGLLNEERRWTLAVPSGATNLKFELSGGTGNADLYVRANSAPTASAYDCRPYLSGNAEACTIAAPVGGTWHVMVKARAAYSGASLKASFTAPNAVLVNNVAQTGIAGLLNEERRWTLAVPSGRSSLRIELSGGSGNADLYVRFGSAPTLSTYTCRPYLSGNAETCTISNPSAGTWHVMTKARAAFSGATIKAGY